VSTALTSPPAPTAKRVSVAVGERDTMALGIGLATVVAVDAADDCCTGTAAVVGALVGVVRTVLVNGGAVVGATAVTRGVLQAARTASATNIVQRGLRGLNPL
jgi:hypothetical protein